MTAALMCDGCGRIATDRDENDRTAEAWYELSQNPSIIGPGLTSAAHGLLMSSIADGVDEIEPVRIEIEAPLHFCSRDCLTEWARR